jgi:4-hydroxy-tetrahydrodipicolinate synthase
MFTGTYTAIVTPFKNGEVDETALNRLIQLQIKGGVDGIVPVGTTGESPTVDYDEHVNIIALAVKFARGKIKVLAGTGANSTKEAIYLTQRAEDVGADGSLQVAPYYNKPSQAGLYAHFRAIAEAAEIPLILYNIPGRCGVDISNDTMARLRRDLPQYIVGLKEATGVVDRVSQLRGMVDREFCILSGDDSLTLPMMSVGAVGVISVVSNVIPRELTEMTHAALKGDFERAGRIHTKVFPLFKDLFIETNPVPVKAAMAMMGLIEETYRLPLVPLADANRAQLRKTLQALGLVKA